MIPGVADCVRLNGMPLQPPLQAFLVPISAFPVPDPELATLTTFLRTLTAAAAREWDLSSEVFVQLEQLKVGGARALFSEHAPEWIPEVGLGVWPDRDPPAIWTREEFKNAVPGERLRPLMYQVFRVGTSPASRERAREIMLGCGPVLQIMAVDCDRFFRETSALFLSRIKHRSYRSFPFYVPLLEKKTLETAKPDQLEAWFCSATVYIRQSFEDKAIVIASREPLTPILEELGGRFEKKPEPVWRIPC